MNEEQLQELITILKSEIETWDKQRKSDYISKDKKLVSHGRWAEARYILIQIGEIQRG